MSSRPGRWRSRSERPGRRVAWPGARSRTCRAARAFEGRRAAPAPSGNWTRSDVREQKILKCPDRLVERSRRERLLRELPARDRLDRIRSEEHTSELQSRGQQVCRLLLDKKNAEEPAVAPVMLDNEAAD